MTGLGHTVTPESGAHQQLLAKLFPDLITGIQNTAFCQTNGIQFKRTDNGF